jgi:regulator of sirC expression with transglutaminase-like and TPR domain
MFALVALDPLSAEAAEREPRTSPAAAVATILSAPDDQLDYGRAKIAFDRIVDPSINGHAVETQIDQLVAAARAKADPAAPYLVRLKAVREVIYEAGSWNDYRPFSYDLKDPLGQTLRHKLLSDYLQTRLGNCVSMPLLFLIVADRAGIANVALAQAPLHYFVRITLPDGRQANLETTSGGYPARDEYIRQNMPMTDRAIQGGIYMRSLTKREAIADMATNVADNLLAQERYEDVIAVEEVVLRNFPHDVYAMLKEGSAYARLIKTEFEDKYASENQIPPDLRPRYEMLLARNKALFDEAEALGWRASPSGGGS